MIVNCPGHRFSLESLDGDFKQTLTFVQRVGPHYPGNEAAHSGTTSQEVLRALISRAKYVQEQTPCAETAASIWLMRAIIFLYEWRAKRVKGRRLELGTFRRIELYTTCETCGHVLCKEHL